MKTKFMLAIIAITMTFASCKKEEEAKVTPQPTTLEFTVKNSLGNSVAGATVMLYSSLTNMQNLTNPIGDPKTTDANGKVTISNLQAIKYYYRVEKDCENNINGATSIANNLTANSNNVVTVILSKTGDFMFQNTSSNPYNVYINGELIGDIDGNTTQPLYYQPIGSYTIKVVQKSGYVISPTENNFTSNLICGQTISVVFPQK
ncbi:MAG TPA: hypothetical protein DCS19_07420 [Flavobacterium sp.]|nr:hypothetical protein [Flavobacterium sp.]